MAKTNEHFLGVSFTVCCDVLARKIQTDRHFCIFDYIIIRVVDLDIQYKPYVSDVATQSIKYCKNFRGDFRGKHKTPYGFSITLSISIPH